VFWHDDGARYLNIASRFCAIIRRVEDLAKKDGRAFRAFQFHDLRHWFAVDDLKRGGGNIYDLQQVMGHRSIKTTVIYRDYLAPDEPRQSKHGPAQIPAQV